MSSFKARAEHKGISLDKRFAVDLPALAKGDPHRLRQILANLIGNAVKFTEKGRVEVEATADFSVGPERFVLRAVVRDPVVGIPPERQSHIFERFSQVDTSLTRQFGGTGLGLAITKQLAEMMGGSVEFSSKLDHGSEFRVALPLLAVAAPGSRAPSAHDGAPRGTARRIRDPATGALNPPHPHHRAHGPRDALRPRQRSGCGDGACPNPCAGPP